MNFTDLTAVLYETLVRGTVQGSIVLGAVYLACRLVPGVPAWAKSWLWRLAWLRVIIAVVTAASIDVPLLPAMPLQQREFAPEPQFVTQTVIEANSNPAPIAQPRSYAAQDCLVAIWGLGVLLMLARLAHHFETARRLRKIGKVFTQTEIVARLDGLALEMKVRAPALLVSTSVSKPLLTGIFRPAIIVPPSVFTLGETNITLIFKHELAHLKRRDVAWNIVAAMAQALLWFNPLTWLCERESHFTQEVACDEFALRNEPRGAAEFANLLVEIAAGRDATPKIVAVGMIRTARTLERRLKAMKTIKQKGSRQLIATCAIALALTPALLPWRVVAQKNDTAAQNAVPVERHEPTDATVEKRPANNSSAEEDLLAQEIKLARKDLEAAERARQNGVVGSEEITRQRREVQKLERELARLRGDAPRIRESLQDEIKEVEKLQVEAANRVAVGVSSSEEKNKVDRELLRLKRELAAFDRERAAKLGETSQPQSMLYYMQNPELMKRYFPQMYAMMMSRGSDAIPGTFNPPTASNPAQESFQQRLNRASAERRSAIHLQPKRAGVVVRVAVKPGEQVKAGQELVILDGREASIRLRAAEAEYEIAQTDHRLKKKEAESALNFALAQNRGGPEEYKKSREEDYELKVKRLDSELRLASIKLEQAKLQMDDLTIRAPSDGIIGTTPSAGQSLSESSVAIEFLPDPPK